jgi:predicted RNA-binding protein
MSFNERVEYFKKLFGLDNWKFTIKYAIQNENNNAKTLADPRYKTARITVYPILLNNKDMWDEIIVHELIHVVMSLYDFYVDNLGHEIKNEKGEIITDELFFIARENAVSELTTIFMRINSKV